MFRRRVGNVTQISSLVCNLRNGVWIPKLSSCHVFSVSEWSHHTDDFRGSPFLTLPRMLSSFSRDSNFQKSRPPAEGLSSFSFSPAASHNSGNRAITAATANVGPPNRTGSPKAFVHPSLKHRVPGLVMMEDKPRQSTVNSLPSKTISLGSRTNTLPSSLLHSPPISPSVGPGRKTIIRRTIVKKKLRPSAATSAATEMKVSPISRESPSSFIRSANAVGSAEAASRLSNTEVHSQHLQRTSSPSLSSHLMMKKTPLLSPSLKRIVTHEKDSSDLEDAAGSADAKMEELCGTDAARELGVEAAYLHQSISAAAELDELESSRLNDDEDLRTVEEEEILEFCDEVGQQGASLSSSSSVAKRASLPSSEHKSSSSASFRSPTSTDPSLSLTFASRVDSSNSTQRSSAETPTLPLVSPTSFEFDSPLNLRLATLTRQSGKAFRALIVTFPLKRAGSSMDFELTFEDIAGSARLVCKLSEIKSLYFTWISQFRATFIALFVPTLHHPSAVLLQHAILNGLPPRSSPSLENQNPRLPEDADHLFCSYDKIHEVIVSKHEKIRETLKEKQRTGAVNEERTSLCANSSPIARNPEQSINIPLLTVTLMNTTPEEWHAFIASPLACVPQDFFLAAFNYRPSAQTSITATLNKELLLSQLSAAARTLLFYSQVSHKGNAIVSTSASSEDFTSLSTAIAAASPARPGVMSSSATLWKLVFVSSPTKTVVVPPLMQDLVSGQFVEPIVLSGQHVLYIIGTGNACLAFHQLPTTRKGKHAISILLQDIESQLGLHRPHRVNLTAVLTQALESFSRRTWMGIMKLESGQLHAPGPANAFYRFQRRSTPREIVPSFLEEVFGSGSRSASQSAGSSSGAVNQVGDGRHLAMSGTEGMSRHQLEGQPLSKEVGRYVSSIYNNPDRFEREKNLRDELLKCRATFIHLHTAGVTAARRSDNPFSNRNGIVEAWVQRWDSLVDGASRPITKHYRCRAKDATKDIGDEVENADEKLRHKQGPTNTVRDTSLSTSSSSSSPVFLAPDDILPPDFPTKPKTDPNAALRACNCIIIAWDVKRTLLFLRTSRRLREFLYNGGRVWCAQYAQYLLRGCDFHHLATLDRTWAMCDDPGKPPLLKPLSPVGKLRVIFDMQLQLAVHARHLCSLTQRMDGLLATTEMENNGLRVVPQRMVSRFAEQLIQQREQSEKELQAKIMDFTKNMDDSVRKRINFRSPQDISTIIYGGGLSRYLTSRFAPIRPPNYPITSLFPHFACHVTSTNVPRLYTQSETFLGSFLAGKTFTTSTGAVTFTKRQVDDALQTIQLCSRTHLPRGSNRASASSVLLANTAIVVLVCKASMGGMLEHVSLYCPTVAECGKPHLVRSPQGALGEIEKNEDGKRSAHELKEEKDEGTVSARGNGRSFSSVGDAAGDIELRVRVAVDEVTPPTSPSASRAAKDPVLTVMQLKDKIRVFPPLQKLRESLHSKHHLRVKAIQNLLILTDCTHDRLEVLVDTGVIRTIKETVLGGGSGNKDRPSSSERRRDGYSEVTEMEDSGSLFALPVERVCFADLNKAIPATPSTDDSFESDFTTLTARPPSGNVSAKETWEGLAKESILGHGGFESFFHNMLSHCSSLLGTPRDPFRSSHPLPSALPQGMHRQEQASTDGVLWMATPPNLHPILHSFLQGRGASSSADAIERITVFLSPYKKNIDLSFFKCLQQLRFTEKKLQLFEEGCLFRAVLPECHDRVHGEFCHCVTATGRLSSQSPNLQNIPREEDLRRLFVSRFGTQEGRMIEADYSQLEVVVLATLSGDRRMTEEIQRKVDFHCLRVSLMLKQPYEVVEEKVKKEKNPQYIQLRQQAKVFSFQRQYGAGISTISTTTGLSEKEVETLIAAEDQHYNGLSRYYQLVEGVVDAGSERLLRHRQLERALPVHLRRAVLLSTPKNYFVVPTGSKFDLCRDRKSGPRLKNYPVQGLAGEIVQIMCGELVRHFYKKRNYNSRAFLVNTVHDCVWVDCHKSVIEVVKKDIAQIMQGTQQRLAVLWPDVTFDVPFNAAIQSGPSLGELTSD